MSNSDKNGSSKSNTQSTGSVIIKKSALTAPKSPISESRPSSPAKPNTPTVSSSSGNSSGNKKK